MKYPGMTCIIWFALLLLILSGCSQSQEGIIPRQVQFSQSQPGVLKVMTFNIRCGTADDGPNRWAYRKNIVFDLLTEYGGDVVGLQEALDVPIKELRRALPAYQIVVVAGNDGKRTGQACPILFRRDRFKLADSGAFWFSNSPWRPGTRHWGNEIPRICAWVRLIDIPSHRGFYVYNLHLDHQSQLSRRKSTELLAKEISKRQHKDPFVVMGDFNMDMNNPAMLYLQEIGYQTPCPRLVDSWQMLYRSQQQAGTYHQFQGELSGPKIDHIFVTDDTEIIEVAINRRKFGGRYPSDHFPVYAEIQLFK